MSWLTDNIKEYLDENVHVADYTIREMAEDLEHMVDEYEKEYSPYRWHDLRKNPEDLPKCDTDVHIVFKNGKQALRRYYVGSKYRYGVVGDEAGCAFSNYTDVIAWKAIEPFEEVEG